MNRADNLALFVSLAAIAAFLVYRRDDSTVEESTPIYIPDDTYTYPTDEYVNVPSEDDYLRAFLFAIRSSENSDSRFTDSDRYNTFYGLSRFFNLSDHPVLTGEKRGIPLPDSMCRAAGFGTGCVSTAAGAYQIIAPTWQRVRQAGAWGPRLPDFSPDSQDEAARRLLIECGALPYVLTGEITTAARLASPLWASLPGSRAGQRPKTIEQFAAYFDAGLNYG